MASLSVSCGCPNTADAAGLAKPWCCIQTSMTIYYIIKWTQESCPTATSSIGGASMTGSLGVVDSERCTVCDTNVHYTIVHSGPHLVHATYLCQLHTSCNLMQVALAVETDNATGKEAASSQLRCNIANCSHRMQHRTVHLSHSAGKRKRFEQACLQTVLPDTVIWEFRDRQYSTWQHCIRL